MPKDKYSENHTIEVVSGGKSLTVKDNLIVSNDITVGGEIVTDTIVVISGNISAAQDLRAGNNLEVNRDADIGGNLEVGGTLSASGNIVGDDFEFRDSTTRILKWISATELQYAVLTPSYLATANTDINVPNNDFSNGDEYPTLTVGHTTNPGWEVYFPLDTYVPNGATIKSIYFVAENDVGTKLGGFQFQCDIESSLLSGSDLFASEEIDSGTGAGVTGERVLISFSYSGVTVDTSDDIFTSKLYRARLKQNDVDPCIITIAKMGIVYEINTLSKALGVD